MRLVFHICFLLLFSLDARVEDMKFPHDKACQSLRQKLVAFSKGARQKEIELQRTEKKLETLSVRNNAITKALELRYSQLQKIICAVQNLARRGPEVLVSTDTSINGIIHASMMLRSLTNTLVHHNKKLKVELEELSQIHKEIDLERAKIKSATQILKKRYDEIDKLLKRRRSLLKMEAEKQRKIEARANKLAKESANIHELIRKMSVKKPEPGKKISLDRHGKYEFLPVQGPVVSMYGHPSPNNPNGKGIVFTSRPQALVLSPIDGEILFSGPFRRYQNLVIIKHHNNYYTLLAGLERLDAEVGKHVEAGEPIGLVPNKKNAPIYMELRAENDPINPQGWIESLIQ